MNKFKKRRIDFLSNHQNRYAIRRFSLGTASIFLGAMFIGGIHSNDASAATMTMQDASQANVDIIDKQIEENGTYTSEKTPTNQSSMEVSKQEETVTKDNVTQETTQSKVSSTDFSKTTSVNNTETLQQQSAPIPQADLSSGNNGISKDSFPLAEPKQIPHSTDSVQVEARTVSNNDVLEKEKHIIVADALANKYIQYQNDATSAAHTLSGRAWIVDRGTPATFSNGLTPVPEGTKVYMQWIDKDGAVSPIYQAQTTNQLSQADGNQVGPGAYAFDLRVPWIDANGRSHIYRAVAGQYYRLWIDDFKTPEGNTATMLRQTGGFFPGSYVNSVTYFNLGQFPFIGVNMQRTGIFMEVLPTNHYMTTSHWIDDKKGTLSYPAVVISPNDFISGKVWLETGAGDYANSGTGPNHNYKDIVKAGYQVVLSTLTREGASAYDKSVSYLSKKDQPAAVRRLLTEHPEYIAATVKGVTDSNGKYTVRFPKGTLNRNYIYGFVLDRQGNVIKSYSSFTSPLYQKPNSNLLFTPQTAPYHRPIRNAWVNLNFALVATVKTTVNITNFDVVANPAKRGDTAYIDILASDISPLPTFIEWRDSSGRVVQKSKQVYTVQEAKAAGTFKIPNNAKSGEIYTVYVVSGGNDIAADSLLVQVNEKAMHYQPTYLLSTVAQGQTITIPAPVNENGSALPTGTTFSVGNHGQSWAKVNHNGSIIVSPDAHVAAGIYDIPVVVTYSDGSKETVFAPVQVKIVEPLAKQYDPVHENVNKAFGIPTTVSDVTGSVSIPNYPENMAPPIVSVNDPAQLPDGQTAGTVEIGVTVTYPDGSTDIITVPVTTNEKINLESPEPSGDITPKIMPNHPNKTISKPRITSSVLDKDRYEPESKGLKKAYGTPTTIKDVTESVSIPHYPKNMASPKVTVDDSSQLPDGKTEGTVDVSVTVTYPDGSQDHIKVPITVSEGPSQAVQHHPGYKKHFVHPGEHLHVNQTGDWWMPEGTRYKIGGLIPRGWTVSVQAHNGRVTVIAPKNGVSTPMIHIPIVVTYPDGSYESIELIVMIQHSSQVEHNKSVIKPVANRPEGHLNQESDLHHKPTFGQSMEKKENRETNMVRSPYTTLHDEDVAEKQTMHQLPETGTEDMKNERIIGILFAIIGGGFLFCRRRKSNKAK
ncbi:Rib/alpha-like domain-containing protein [Staphylococcus lutrae]|uniref:Gram-positive cocci surface proteins LPxTG domain-containing protein n=1 Tax=Staphylococcus lutrae TaxID=155085 RepID=A0AAC9WIW1_9STAP|nr:Rib/alpha-like domain-containing protein [Staphylococcus lutrae]ARJ50669.1 hypothetical protein B5P37_04720 [Staphylococcus lutrae]PNZ39111.1 adhesin [Staphylococcus lutrae]